MGCLRMAKVANVGSKRVLDKVRGDDEPVVSAGTLAPKQSSPASTLSLPMEPMRPEDVLKKATVQAGCFRS